MIRWESQILNMHALFWGNTLLDSILLSTGNLLFPFYSPLLHFGIGAFTLCHCVFKVYNFLPYKGSQIKDYLGSGKKVWILEQC